MIEYTVQVHDDRTEWRLNGKRHREGGPALEYPNGHKEWYKNGKFHRWNGPAIEYLSGYKAWYKEGLRSRLDGPAIIYSDGSKYWYIEGVQYTEEEFNKKVKPPSLDGKAIEVEGKKYQLKEVIR